jgi:phosphoglycerol transferase MdoB-like AlkP superfamily enzyme
MREVRQHKQPSIIHALREQAGLKAYAFSSMGLEFENVDGMLRSFGVETRLETRELLGGRAGSSAPSSFGSDDGPLYRLSAEKLANDGESFSAVFFPLGAHYPYNCTNQKQQGVNHEAYLNCLAYSDQLLSEMLGLFESKGLLDGTLFVLVGDHGEAFGEHGVYAHNSSVYEEEVAVPLLFWSKDGSLDLGRLPDCRQVDIAPTLADLFGLGGEMPVQGESLLRLSRAPAIFMSTFFDASALALLEPPVKFMYEPATDRLVRFDLSLDPLERRGTSVVDPGRKQAVVERLRAFQDYQRAAFTTP